MFSSSQVRVATIATILACLAGALILGVVVYYLRHVLLWLLIAFFLAVAFNPLVDRLEARMPRALAVTVVALGVLVLLAAALLLVIPTLVHQISELIASAPEIANRVTHNPRVVALEARFHFFERIRAGLLALPGYLSQAASPALALATDVARGIFGVITVFFLTLFMMLGGPKGLSAFLEPFSASTQERMVRLGSHIYRSTTRYSLGVLAIAAIAGTVTTILLAIVGVPFYLPLGLVVAMLTLIPLVGATIGGFISVAVTWATVGFTRAMVLLGIYVVYQLVENHLIYPAIHRHTVRLSSLTIVVALVVGAELAGVVGAVLAIPITGALSIVWRELLNLYKESHSGLIVPSPGSPPARPRPLPGPSHPHHRH